MGSVGYLDILLSSGSLYELVSNYYLISEITENDKALLDKIEATKNAIIEQKEYIESAKEELETNKKNMQSKKLTLAASKDKKQTLVANLNEEEASLEKELEEFEKDKRRIQQELAALAKNSVITVSPGGYISPLSGKSKANITTGYGRYSWGGNHTGVDFATSGGTPIYAVKAGTVVTSTALKYSNGNYKSYGEYIVIDHHDGTMTLYAHMQPGSRAVGVNQSVYQGQQIGSVGQTGNATGNHLHFEVRINGKPVNPTSYLP
jgi:murein DD-endopeptidase MepM/ murein hydrolase activator NlpD